MGIVFTIVFGFFVGLIAKLIMPGKQNMNWIVTILLGIGGSFLGNFIANLIWRSEGGSSIGGWIVSILGAMLIIFVYEKVMEKQGKK